MYVAWAWPKPGLSIKAFRLGPNDKKFFIFFWYHITGSEDRCDSHLYFRYIVFYFLNKLNHLNFNKIFLVSYNSYVCCLCFLNIFCLEIYINIFFYLLKFIFDFNTI